MEDIGRVCEIENDFDILEVIKDPRFGTISLMKCIKDENIIIMRKDRQSSTQEEFHQDIRNIKERKQLTHPNLLEMPDFSS